MKNDILKTSLFPARVCLMVLILDGNSYIGKKSLLFDLCKALNKVECSKKSDLFSPKNLHSF